MIDGKGKVIDEPVEGTLPQPGPTERIKNITAVPYCVWDNRDPGRNAGVASGAKQIRG